MPEEIWPLAEDAPVLKPIRAQPDDDKRPYGLRIPEEVLEKLSHTLLPGDPEYGYPKTAYNPSSISASAGTHNGSTYQQIVDYARREAKRSRYEEEREEAAAQQLMLQLLSYCIVRLGGEVVVPSDVLANSKYTLSYHKDSELDRVKVTAEEVVDDDSFEDDV